MSVPFFSPTRRTPGRTLFLVVLSFLVVHDSLFVANAALPDLEYQVKAVFLLRFAQFTEWPAEESDSDEPFVVGILGEDPFGPFLEDSARDMRVAGRRIIVLRFADPDQLADSKQPHLLYVSRSLKSDLVRVISDLKGHPVLTVSDIRGFVRQGGIIEFVTERDRVGFRINRDAAWVTGVRLTSKLLRAATLVEGG